MEQVLDRQLKSTAIMNPVGSKIQKIKKSFKPELHFTADSTYTDIRSQDALFDSTSLNNLPDSFPISKPLQPTTQDQGFQTNALLQRIFHLQDRVDRQEHSITFYLRELNRREHHHQQQLNKSQRAYSEKVDCLERLLQIEVGKNISLERQLSRLSRYSQEEKENIGQYRKSQLKRLSMAELSELVNSVQDELDSRKRRNEPIEIKPSTRTPPRNQQAHTLSLTEDSALLSDYKEIIRHY